MWATSAVRCRPPSTAGGSGEGIDTSVALIARDSGILVGYLPMLERLTDIAHPLEGTVQRLGRVVDRLPGGTTASRAATGRPAAETVRGLGRVLPVMAERGVGGLEFQDG